MNEAQPSQPIALLVERSAGAYELHFHGSSWPLEASSADEAIEEAEEALGVEVDGWAPAAAPADAVSALRAIFA